MKIFGVKFKILDYLFFFFYFCFWGLYFLIHLIDGDPLVYLLVEVWFVFFPYFFAYKYKYIHSQTLVMTNFITTFIVNTIIMFVLLPNGFSKESCESLGLFTYIYFFLAFTCFFAENNDLIEKNPTNQNKQIKNNGKVQSNTSNVNNIDIKNLDFNKLKEIPQEELERSMANYLKNNGFSCMVARLPELNLLLSINNQYSVGFNFLDSPVSIEFIEALARGMQTHNLKLVIISKNPYSEEVVNRCEINGLGIELLIEEDFKNITNYFYRPKYEVLGSSFFDLIQSRVLEYKKDMNVVAVKECKEKIAKIEKGQQTIKGWKKVYRDKKIREQIDLLFSNSSEITPKELFDLRNKSLKNNTFSQLNTDGVYILHNQTKNMYYIGQSIGLLNRVNNHFTGKGNGDVYADYKYGDKFTIKMLSLKNSGYETLNDLERETIEAYSLKFKLYNKTKGNK